jgi:hypothetical protein
MHKIIKAVCGLIIAIIICLTLSILGSNIDGFFDFGGPSKSGTRTVQIPDLMRQYGPSEIQRYIEDISLV